MKILIVDDEKKLRDLIAMYLEKEGYIVESACDGKEGLQKAREYGFDLFIIDVMMPKVDGFALMQEIRKSMDTPIIMVTARGEEEEKILGFEYGCDDYIVKPFSPRELVHRVKAILKRSKKKSRVLPIDELAFPRLIININTRKVIVDGKKEVNLTPKEFELLYFLANSPGRVYKREQLLENIWGYDFEGDVRTIDTHIKKIREKLGRDQGPDYINTIWGLGYKFEVNNEEI